MICMHMCIVYVHAVYVHAVYVQVCQLLQILPSKYSCPHICRCFKQALGSRISIIIFFTADQTSKKNSKGLYCRVSGYLSESMTSVPTKVSDDPTVFAMIMSEFRVYEHHRQVIILIDLSRPHNLCTLIASCI